VIDMADASATPAAAPATAPEAAPAGSNEGQASAAPAAPPEPARDPSLPPRYSELGKRAAADKAAREEQAQREQDARDAQAYRALVAAGYSPQRAAAAVSDAQPKAPASTRGRKLEIDLDDPGSLRAAIGDDKAFREYLNATARHVVSPDVVRLERELASSKARLPDDYDEVRTTVKTLAEQRAVEQQERVQLAFIATTEAKGEADAARFPFLAGLDPHERIAYAQGVIADYQEQGYDPNKLSLDFVAEQTEEYLAGLHRKLSARVPPPDATRPPALATQPRPQGTHPQRRSQGTRSLTNAMATPEAPPKDLGKMTPDERRAWTLQRHKARRAGARP